MIDWLINKINWLINKINWIFSGIGIPILGGIVC